MLVKQKSQCPALIINQADNSFQGKGKFVFLGAVEKKNLFLG